MNGEELIALLSEVTNPSELPDFEGIWEVIKKKELNPILGIKVFENWEKGLSVKQKLDKIMMFYEGIDYEYFSFLLENLKREGKISKKDFFNYKNRYVDKFIERGGHYIFESSKKVIVMLKDEDIKDRREEIFNSLFTRRVPLEYKGMKEIIELSHSLGLITKREKGVYLYRAIYKIKESFKDELIRHFIPQLEESFYDIIKDESIDWPTKIEIMDIYNFLTDSRKAKESREEKWIIKNLHKQRLSIDKKLGLSKRKEEPKKEKTINHSTT